MASSCKHQYQTTDSHSMSIVDTMPKIPELQNIEEEDNRQVIPLTKKHKGPSTYDVHTEGEGVRLMWTPVDCEGVSAMWTSTQKIMAH